MRCVLAQGLKEICRNFGTAIVYQAGVCLSDQGEQRLHLRSKKIYYGYIVKKTVLQASLSNSGQLVVSYCWKE